MEANKAQIAFQRLLNIMDDLRSGCPWDRKQTLDSLRPLTIEETYELADAILNKDFDGIKEELGDVMLHLVFYAKIASEQNQFEISEAIDDLCEKLIRRHPHIYGEVNVNDENEVKANWEKIKLQEKAKKKEKNSVFDGVPLALPALIKAIRIQEKAAGVGFDWDNIADVKSKVLEEVQELQIEISDQNYEKTEEEFGDLMFALVNYARFLKIDPEKALQNANRKFINRFQKMEQVAKTGQKQLSSMTLNEMEQLWQDAKNSEIS